MSKFTFTHKVKFIVPKILMVLLLFGGLSFELHAQTGTFNWWNGTSGNQWIYTNTSQTYTVPCGVGCTVNVTMEIIDPNNRNADANINTPHPYGDTNGTCGWLAISPFTTSNANGNPAGATGTFNDPWDASCIAGVNTASPGASIETETNGAYGLGFLTFGMKSVTHLDNVTIRFTFSKPVFMSNFAVSDIDGRTLLQDRTDNQSGTPPLDVRELPGNSFQDELIFSASGPNGNVPVTLTPGVTPNLMLINGQSVRSVYNANTANLSPTDLAGTIIVSTSQAITSIDITYSNGEDDALAEQANPTWYSWWSATNGATNGVSDDHAVRIPGFTFTACPDFIFTKTDATVCEGQTANIGVSTSNGTSPYTYSWTGPNGFSSSAQNPSIPNATSTQAGVYTVLVTDAATCFFTATASVTVNSLPVPNSGSNSPVCVGQNINLTSGGGTSYQWSGPNGFSSSLQNPIINNAAISQGGNYTVTVTNASGCTATAQTAVIVNPLPTPTAGNDSPVCEGGTVNLNASGGTTYSWSGPNGFSSNTQNPQISNIALTGGGIYTVTVTDANGCTATAQTTITVNPLPSPTAGSDSPVCVGETINLSGSGGVSYNWSGSNAFSSAIQNPTITNVVLGSGGVYTLTVTDANGCTATAQTTVTINPLPIPTAGNDSPVCIGGTLNLNATGGTTYNWTGPDGFSSNTQNPQISNITSNAAGNYTVTVTDINGCTATDQTLVTLNPLPTPTAGNDSPVCEGGTVNLNASGGTTYSWSGPNGYSSNTQNPQISNIALTGGGIYTVTVTDANGCTATAQTTVVINNIPVISIIDTICTQQGDFYSLEFNVTTGANVTTNIGTVNGNFVENIPSGNEVTIYFELNNCGDSIKINQLCPIPYGSIGDKVFSDIDGDGIQDASEPGLDGIKVYLLDGSGNIIDSTLTAGGGLYVFDSLLSGTYQVQFVNPDGTVFSPQGAGTPETDSNPNALGITDPITIDTSLPEGDPGRDNTSIDAGIVPLGSIGDYVWVDEDRDGVQDAGEPPVSGMTVYLLDANDNIIDSTITDANGYYLFVSLLAGDYKVQFIKDPETSFTDANQGTDDSLDSDADATGLTGTISLAPGEDKTDVDAGITTNYGSIGDKVFSDIDGDGIQDAAEPGIDGIKVYLLDGSGNIIDSTLTAGGGLYVFDSLLSGTYQVQFVNPDGTVFSPQGVGADSTLDSNPNALGITDPISIDTSLPEGDPGRDNTSIDAGIVPLGSIGDYVWVDEDRDGIQDAGEAPVSGMTVYLLDANDNIIDSTITDANGYYLFDSLLAGDYKVQFIKDPETSFTDANQGTDDSLDSDADATGLTGTISLAPGEDKTDVDAGITTNYGSIGDKVFSDIDGDGIQDAAEPGIDGIKVYLLDGSGNIIDSTLTAGGGLYVFDSLLSGTYQVQFVNPDGMVFSPQGVGADSTIDSNPNAMGVTDPITIDTSLPEGDPGRDNTSIDAGIVPLGSIGDYVWVDEDRDGIQDTGEPPVSGMTVYLLDANDNIIDSTITDANGYYLFDSLLAGDYKVQFIKDPETSFTDANQGTDDSLDSDADATGLTGTITLAPGEDKTDVDAGITTNYGSIGDKVFSDIDGDGIQDVAEPGIDGIKVYLLDGSGNIIDSTLTAGGGLYVFDSLLSGTYQVQFVNPDGTVFSPQGAGADSTIDSNPNALGITDPITIDTSLPEGDPGRDNTSIDAGIVPLGSIGDYVWVDEDRDGIQDAGEPPVSGITVYLLDANDNIIDSTITDANGYYLFDSLLAGDYKVQFIKDPETSFTDANQGTDDSLDSDADATGLTGTITLAPGEDKTDVDAGITINYGSIGDKVFSDIDGDGIQDVAEPGIDGIKVYLLDGSGNIIDSTLTAGGGLYVFDSLLSGTYQVQFVNPDGTVFSPQGAGADSTIDSNPNALGITDPITIDTSLPEGDPGRDNTSIDAGIVPLGSIGDYVWVDEDRDGIQDAGEPPVSGMTVYLLDANDNIINSTITDANGYYLFDSLLAGDYKVQFIKDPETSFTDANQGSDDGIDSDADAAGLTGTITLAPGEDKTDVDAGITINYGSIGDKVFSDIDGDGIQDAGEPGIDGIKVYLLDGSGNIIDSTLTAGGGLYVFDSLLSGTYQVQFINPDGTVFSPQGVGADSTLDSNPNAIGITDPISIDTSLPEGDPGRDNTSIDAGIVPLGSIGDYVWIDEDRDGIQDAGEPPVSGMTVYLLDANDNIIDSTITDANGYYLFDSLLAGDYKVQFIKDPETSFTDANQGSDDGIDSDADAAGLSGTITLAPGEDKTDVDAGITINYGSIGDKVFSDIDGDGIQDAGEPGIDGIKVYLLDGSGNIIDSTLTAGGGLYVFDSLLSGTYQVQFVNPDGTVFSPQGAGADSTLDSNPNALGITDPISIDTSLPEGDPGRDNTSIDAGIVPLGSIGDYVWIDEDRDGIQDAGEPPVSGMTVYLLDANDNIINSTITDANGYYLFDSLLAGDYKVQFIKDPETSFTDANQGTDDSLDSDADATGLTGTITLAPGEDKTDVDAGITINYGSIGDKVFSDIDGDGIQDAAEPGIDGIKVYLLDGSGNIIDSTLTAGGGLYVFDSLLSGTYQVQFVNPDGTVFSPQGAGADSTIDSNPNALGITDPISIDTSLPEGDPGRDNTSIDAGIVPLGSIGDYVWVDEDRDGIQDAGEPPVSGMTVYLLDANDNIIDSTITDANGYYLFDSLLAGDYKVQFIKDPETSFTDANQGSDDGIDSDVDAAGLTGTITLAPGEDKTDVDAGITTNYGSIGDKVFSDIDGDGIQDAAEPGIDGIKVYLLDDSGNIIDSTLTAGGGLYVFDSLLSGTYQVQFVNPDGTVFSPQGAGADSTIDSNPNALGITDPITIDTSLPEGDPGRDNTNIDAGIVPLGSIGDYVWIDEDRDGIQDAGEPPVSGMTVYLLDANDNIIDSTITDANGYYLFDSLLAGDYKVQFIKDPETSFTDANQGSDDGIDSDVDAAGLTGTITLAPGEDKTDVDAGITTNYGSIGDKVFSDIDGDGIQDAAEPGIDGIKVYLLDGSGNIIDSTLTAGGGLYVFDSLLSGTYQVQFVNPDGTVFSPQGAGADSTIDSNPNALGITDPITIDTSLPEGDPGRDNTSIDAGIVPLGSIGDYVWVDEDRDGIQDAGEPPVSGMTVYLLDANDNIIDSTITDANGMYLFDSLLAGDYKVQFVSLPGSSFTDANQGSDNSLDSEADATGLTGTITLAPGEDKTDVDAGITINYGSIGDKVFSDIDGDGIQDAAEPGLDGIKVYLLDGSGNIIDSTLTAGGGLYVFDSLLSGTYQVQFVNPDGTVFSPQGAGADSTIDSNPNALGITDPITIDTSLPEGDPGRDNTSIDAGIVPLGSIGDYVWIDEDRDGIQDAGEPPVSGMTVYLLDANDNIIDSTITDANGYYLFDSLLAGDYKVQFVSLPGSSFTDANQGSDDSIDSDADATGLTGTITLAPGEDKTDVDAGITINYGSIGDKVFSDIDGDGIQDAAEPGIDGIKVYLLDGSGNIIDSTLTAGGGLYVFDSLLSGTYQVQFVNPDGTVFSPQGAGADSTIDSNPNALGITDPITIDTSLPEGDPGRDNTSIDAGIVPLGSIGDYVWVDEDRDGIQDAGEPPVSGITVYLLDANDNIIDSTITDANGYYLFDSLLAGDYKVQFIKDPETSFTDANQGTDDSLDSDADATGLTGTITLAPGEDKTDVDAGITTNYGSIGDKVFSDIDGDGIQDAAEPGIDGIKVYLLDGSGNIIDSTLTAGGGLYVFDSLLSGTYQVQFVNPDGTVFSPQGAGTPDTDSNPNAMGITDPISIDTGLPEGDPGRDNTSIDAGIVPLGSIGDYVWIDEDRDGIQDAGEAPVSGMTVYLLDASDNIIDSTITDANGMYLFDSLLAGDYKVQFIKDPETSFTDANQGSDDSIDSDADATGLTGTITLAPGEDKTDVDAGITINYGSIGDKVFSDIDGDGIQDAAEPGLDGIKVYLLDGSGNIIDSTLTAGGGLYVFDSLLSGTYQVQFVNPDGTVFSPQGAGTPDTDSNPNAMGITDPISIDTGLPEGDPGRDNTSIDAGIVPLGSIGDYVWIDEDRDGIQDAGEAPVSGMTVYLLDASDNIIDSTITDANGMYLFDSLLAGDYKVQFIKDPETRFTDANQGSDDSIDSDADATGLTGTITLAPGEDKTDVDAGITINYGSIGDKVFSDIDGDGIQDAAEPGIDGIKVYLLDGSGNIIDSTLTAGGGLYVFDSLLSGTYQVQFVNPDGTVFSPQGAGADSTIDSNPNALGITDPITIDTSLPEGDPGRDNTSIDAGIVPLGSIGDYVWVDEDRDGIQDAGEPPVSGITVYLLDANDNIIDSTITDANGYYLFDSLLAGDYKVQFIKDPETSFTDANQGTDDSLDSDADATGLTGTITLAPGEDKTDVDAGIATNYGSIGDKVFSDIDGDGIQDAAEPGLDGIKVYLLDGSGNIIDSTLTAGGGLYVFDSLLSGTYQVQFVNPDGTVFSPQGAGTPDTDSNPNAMGITDPISIDTGLPEGDPGRDNTSIDAGIVPLGSIGDYVWIDEDRDGIQDAGEAPVSGMTVYLLDASDNIIDSTITDANGMYLFDSLLAGDYKVQFIKDPETSFTDANQGTDDSLDSDADATGLTGTITLAPGEDITDVDAGITINYGSIGDKVFSDIDGDGIQDVAEPGLDSIKVYLLDGSGNIIDSTLTAGGGLYEFDSLLSGTYQVQFVNPDGTVFSPQGVGADSTIDSNPNALGIIDPITIDTGLPEGDPGRDNTSIDAGIVPLGSIGDYVWVDEDRDGIQDAGEPPVSGMTVYLLDANDNIIDSTITDANGYYLFDSLMAGDYKVQFIKDPETSFTDANQGSDDSIDSDADAAGLSGTITLAPGEDKTDVDAGITINYGSIGDKVFSDIDGDGIQDAAEPGLDGIKVYLIDGSGNIIDSTLTAGGGLYVFDSLLSGTYQVQFVNPDGTVFSPQGAGADSTIDSNPNALGITDPITIDTSLPEGDPDRDNTSIDAGIVPLGSIGDYVWVDEDRDGIQDAGEPPVSGITVYLLDANDNIIDNTITDANGYYLFDSLLAGDYKVQFIKDPETSFTDANQGSDESIDSDADATGLTGTITLAPGEDKTDVDAGIIPLGSLGSIVFDDLDGDGQKDLSEPGRSGVKVILYDNLGNKLDSTITDINGFYIFNNLPQGTYRIGFELPDGSSFSPQNIGDDQSDSDPDENGISQPIVLQPIIGDNSIQTINLSIFAGIINQLPPVDVALTKTSNGTCNMQINDLVTYTIKVFRQDNAPGLANLTVRDSLTQNLSIQSISVTHGTYNLLTNTWEGISLNAGDTATMILVSRIMTNIGGLACNTAWVASLDRNDVDSQAGNKDDLEDDMAKSCISTPLNICSEKGESIEISAPMGYATYQWFKNGQMIPGADQMIYLASEGGTYTVQVNNQTGCDIFGCCPIQITDICECPPQICIPIQIRKTK